MMEILTIMYYGLADECVCVRVCEQMIVFVYAMYAARHGSGHLFSCAI